MSEDGVISLVQIILTTIGGAIGVIILKSQAQKYKQADDNEKARTQKIRHDIDNLSYTTSNIATRLNDLRDEVRSMKASIDMISEKSDNNYESFCKAVSAFQKFSEKQNDRFTRIETDLLTILKGGK
jgi:uncharacterized protein YoxC